MHKAITIVCSLILFASCSNTPAVTAKAEKENRAKEIWTVETIEEVEPFTAFQPFWDYYTSKIKLNEDFVGYDDSHQKISKKRFLTILASGNYQPVLINPIDTVRYQLKRSPKKADNFISQYMKLFANQELVFFSMEGNQAPSFDFKTIAGVKYTSANTKGKILLLKCWFIACVPCVQEMPVLNALVNQYKERSDLIFLSLATDDERALKSFLAKTKFNYQTVAQQLEYISTKLHVSAYPTHIIIDKAGKVYKVANDAEQAGEFLKRLLSKNQ